MSDNNRRQGNLKCPLCGAVNKYPDKTLTADYFGSPRNRPVTYVCGTTSSKDWSPPVQGKQCDPNKPAIKS